MFVLVLVCILSVCPCYSSPFFNLCKWLMLILLKVRYSIRNFTEMCHSVHLCCLPLFTGSGCFPKCHGRPGPQNKTLEFQAWATQTTPRQVRPPCSQRWVRGAHCQIHVVCCLCLADGVVQRLPLTSTCSFQTATRDLSIWLFFRKCKCWILQCHFLALNSTFWGKWSGIADELYVQAKDDQLPCLSRPFRRKDRTFTDNTFPFFPQRFSMRFWMF